jgi:hypothetical protein
MFLQYGHLAVLFCDLERISLNAGSALRSVRLYTFCLICPLFTCICDHRDDGDGDGDCIAAVAAAVITVSSPRSAVVAGGITYTGSLPNGLTLTDPLFFSLRSGV